MRDAYGAIVDNGCGQGRDSGAENAGQAQSSLLAGGDKGDSSRHGTARSDREVSKVTQLVTRQAVEEGVHAKRVRFFTVTWRSIDR